MIYGLTTARWRHQMELFSAPLALCERNPSVTGGFLSKRPVRRSFEFSLHLNKRLSKQSGRWWFETPSHSLWCYCYGSVNIGFDNGLAPNRRQATFYISDNPGRSVVFASFRHRDSLKTNPDKHTIQSINKNKRLNTLRHINRYMRRQNGSSLVYITVTS